MSRDLTGTAAPDRTGWDRPGWDPAEASAGFGTFGALLVDGFGERVGITQELRARRLIRRLHRHHPASAAHSIRVAIVTMGMWRKAPTLLGDVETALLGSLLHDVGKLFVPRALLASQGQLSAKERALISSHSELGARLLLRVGFSDRIAAIAQGHHERWTGGGYPTGLPSQDQSPITRAVAVADAFDAMTDPGRAYRAPLSRDEALREVKACTGTHFEPRAAGILAESLSSPAADWAGQPSLRWIGLPDPVAVSLH